MQIHHLFDSYLKRITPPDGELDRARSHRDLVRKRISLTGVKDFINSGSYIKRTALKPLDDIDLFVCFDANAYDKERERIVTRLAYHLNQSFPGKARTQRHSVGVEFSDVRVDVVPGFEVGKTGMFRIRNRIDGRWIETNIDLHKEFFRKRQEKDGRHRDMVMLAKAWNRKRRKRFGSYLIELLVTKAMSGGIPQGRDVALHHFFSWVARNATRQPVLFTDYYARSEATPRAAPLVVLDPTNPRNNVASELDESAVEELVSVADRSRARSGTALDETSRTRAAAIWRELLPDFPVS